MWNDIKRDILLQFRINLALAALVCSLPRVCVCVADATRCEKQRVYSFVLCKYTKNSMFDVERIWGEGEDQRCLLWYAIHIYAAEWSVLGMPKRPFHTKNFVFVCVFECAPRFAIYFWLLLTDAMCALANTINDCTYNRFYCVKFHLLSFVFLISLLSSLSSFLCVLYSVPQTATTHKHTAAAIRLVMTGLFIVVNARWISFSSIILENVIRLCVEWKYWTMHGVLEVRMKASIQSYIRIEHPTQSVIGFTQFDHSNRGGITATSTFNTFRLVYNNCRHRRMLFVYIWQL